MWVPFVVLTKYIRLKLDWNTHVHSHLPGNLYNNCIRILPQASVVCISHGVYMDHHHTQEAVRSLPLALEL